MHAVKVSSASIVRYVVLPLVFVSAVIGILHLRRSNTAAYAAAETFLYSSPEIARHLGKVQTVRLKIGGNSIYEYGLEGDAKLLLSVRGELAQAAVVAVLRRRAAQWRVDRAQVTLANGTSVVIRESMED